MIHAIDTNEAITITPEEAASMLLAYLEVHGARLSLDGERLRVNLVPLPNMDATRADRLARLVLSVRYELRDLLIARNGLTVH